MLAPEDLVYLGDLSRLPLDVLQQMAAQLDIQLKDESVLALASAIFEKSDQARVRLAPARERVFVGKTSVRWYPFARVDADKFFAEARISAGFDLLRRKAVQLDELKSGRPLVLGAARIGTGNRYVVRVAHRRRGSGYVYGIAARPVYAESLSSVVLDFDRGFMEARGEIASAPKLLRAACEQIGYDIGDGKPHEVLTHYSRGIEALAQALGGHIIEAEAIPAEAFEQLTPVQIEALAQALAAVDMFLQTGQADEAMQQIAIARDQLGDGSSLAGLPLSAIFLAGAERLRLSSGADLALQPLYSTLKPYLKHQGGHIRFDWSGQSATIRVGIVTNSVYFVTPAAEGLVDFVRDLIVNGQGGQDRDGTGAVAG